MYYYVAFQVAFAVGLALPVALAADRRARGRFLGLFVAACLLAGAIVLPFALPYLEVREQMGFERTIGEAETPTWYATPRSYLGVAENNRFWGRVSKSSAAEDTLFPGGLALVGAAVGLAGWRRRPALTATLVLIAAVAFVISLGPTWRPGQDGARPLPYRLLFDYFPLFKAMRVPARFGVLAGLAVVALAGLGGAWAWERLAPRFPPQRRRVAGALLTVGLAGLLLAELASVPVALERVDLSPEAAAPYQWLARQPDDGAVLEFPIWLAPQPDGSLKRDLYPVESLERETALSMYWSTVHWKPIVQGYSGFTPRSQTEIFDAFVDKLQRPDGTTSEYISHVSADNIDLLRRLNVRYIVLHRHGYKPEDWPAVIAQLEAIGGAVERVGDFGGAVVYRVNPPTAAVP